MRLPVLSEIAKSRDYQIEFKGYNHNMYVGETQFYDTKNLCATNYPVMAPRALRAKVRTLTKPQGLLARGKMGWVDDGQFYWDGTPYGGKLAEGEKQLVGMGAYILIWPDAVRFSTATREFDRLGAEYSANGEVKMTLCRMDGSDYENITVSESAPDSPVSGAYWLDTSGSAHVLKVYGGEGWVSVGTTYVRIEAEGVGAAFRVGDAVEITGTEVLDGSRLIEGKTENSMIVIGIIDRQITQTGGMKVERSIPEMDFVCELNNRIWGCSSAKHEIYSCKLGDPTNWRNYSGLASDSYAATIGSAGDFTGCCAFGGQVLFWKEDMLHKLMGTKPSNYQIADTPIRGVQKGSEKSIAVVNESLMYKSRECVCIYDGGTPMSVSDALGKMRYYEAAAGAQGNRYYISMRTDKGEWSMFVFDEEKGIWMREDETHAAQFEELDGQLYYLDDSGRMMAVRGLEEAGAEPEETIEWYAETGDMLVNMPDNKYVSRIQIRAGVDKGAKLKLEMQYDSDGVWHKIFERGYSRKASFTVPIIPMRCDHMRMRISGRGRSCIYAVSKEIERGSEI